MTNTIKKKNHFFKTNETIDHARDTGMAIILICLIIYLTCKSHAAVWCAVFFLVLNMAIPQIFKPAAILWFGFSGISGAIVSKLLLTIIYLLIVTPMGFLRRCLGKDTLRLKEFKRSNNTVFYDRSHIFVPEDLIKPY